MADGDPHSSESSAREAPHDAVSSAVGEKVRTFGEPLDPKLEAMGEGFAAMVDAAFEPFARGLSQAFASADGGAPSAQGAIAASSVPLASISEEAARAWLALAKRGVCAHLAALSDLGRCRSAHELVEWHTWVVREQLQIVSEAGDVVAEATTRALEQASRVMQRTSAAPPPGE